jgi:ADP-ribosyl-[dinitrogen reductase] hydrolase
MESIMEWPRSLRVLKQLACELAAPAGEGKAVRYFWPGIIPRNLMFLSIVLFHGFRRLFPPY